MDVIRTCKKGETVMASTIVLAVGLDPVLLVTRSQVLQTAGYTVISVCSLTEAITRFVQGDFDLVLLCHSIPAQDRERLASLIREHTSLTPIIFVSPNFFERERLADATIENDPNNLVTGLREVLRSSGERLNAEDGHAA